MAVQDWPVEACCALGYCGWQGESLATVGEVEEHFARCCFEADQRLGEPAACRWFLNWFDDTPRDQMRAELLAEVRRELYKRRLSELLKPDSVEEWLDKPLDVFAGRTPHEVIELGLTDVLDDMIFRLESGVPT